MPGTPAHVWHPWLRTERVLRAILTEPWSAEAWERIKLEIPESSQSTPGSGKRAGPTRSR
ncbi:MAG: hypothetical protein HY726_12470 [Candidatus Rokubacteria bacterium]|nr:hypothetical protein [Candidatus Rokubacteria bacterium]